MDQTAPTPSHGYIERDAKAKTRSYFTVSLSNKLIEGGKPFKCWECGFRVTTVYNEPIGMVEAKVLPEDAGAQKLTENFCRGCNRIFIFI